MIKTIEYATRIYRLRKSLGLSREELAIRAGISTRTIFRSEKTGLWPMHKSTAAAYKRALGVE